MYEIAKEKYFDEKDLVNKSTRDKSLIRLIKSPAIKASVVSTVLLPGNPNELCDRLRLLFQKNKLEIILTKSMKKLLLY